MVATFRHPKMLLDAIKIPRIIQVDWFCLLTRLALGILCRWGEAGGSIGIVFFSCNANTEVSSA